jgi:hypothetical protein
VFVDRGWLALEFERGKSLEQIGRETGLHASTVSYWARKHSLRSPGAEKYAARGVPDKALLEALVHEGASLREIAEKLDRSIATVRHWLRRWEIERIDCRKKPALSSDAPTEIELRCERHGLALFRLDGRGSYRCKRCGQDRVAARRRKIKRILVDEAGGRCRLCGYDRCIAAMQFHHLDPRQKRFAVSYQGVTRGLEKARAEARKCLLLCANCHAEVEAGYRSLDAA